MRRWITIYPYCFMLFIVLHEHVTFERWKELNMKKIIKYLEFLFSKAEDHVKSVILAPSSVTTRGRWALARCQEWDGPWRKEECACGGRWMSFLLESFFQSWIIWRQNRGLKVMVWTSQNLQRLSAQIPLTKPLWAEPCSWPRLF